MIRAAFLSLGLALAAGSGALAQAQQSPDLEQERAAIADFQALDQQLQDVGWRLARGNAAFCKEVVPSIGLQMQDLASYADPDAARGALGLRGDFAVQTAAAGSPSAESRAFAPNREIVLLDRFDPNDWEADARLDWRRLSKAHDHVDAMLAEHGGIAVGFADGASARIEGVDVCSTRFELATGGKRAVADGSRVQIGANFPGFVMTEDLFAAAVAHELAHNLLGHRAWLDAEGRSRRNIRLSEREADRLMPWLLANAGYDPAAAREFFQVYKPSSGGMLFMSGSHGRWQERAASVEDELELIRKVAPDGQPADWPRHFRREIATSGNQ